MAEIVLEESTNSNVNNSANGHPNQPKVVPRDNTIAGMLTDRNGVPPSPEKLQEFQNRLMGRSKDFSKLPKEEKERIMFQEMQDWHFSQMPSIEQMKKEIQQHPLTFEVKSLNPNDTKGYKNQHINILSENVKLTIVSDGKTIKFNNKELLEQYREAVNKKEHPENQATEVQKRGAESHSTRVFED